MYCLFILRRVISTEYEISYGQISDVPFLSTGSTLADSRDCVWLKFCSELLLYVRWWHLIHHGHCKQHNIRTRTRQIVMDLIQMYHDQGSQSSSSCEEPTFVEPTEDAIGIETAPRPKISQRQMRQQYSQPPPPPPPPPEPQHNGTNGRQLNANELQKIQPANFAQWRTDIDKRVHLCLGSIQFPTTRRIDPNSRIDDFYYLQEL